MLDNYELPIGLKIQKNTNNDDNSTIILLQNYISPQYDKQLFEHIFSTKMDWCSKKKTQKSILNKKNKTKKR